MTDRSKATQVAKSTFIHPVIEALAHQLKQGFENPERLTGRCQFYLHDNDKTRHCLAVTFDSDELILSDQPLDNADACIEMPIAVAEHIIADIEAVDYRDPDIIGAMTMTGQLRLVNHIAKTLVRPSAATEATLAESSHRWRETYTTVSLPYLEDPSELDILENIAGKQPFIIRLKESAHNAWSLTRLKQDYGDIVLRVRSAERQETVREFIEGLESEVQSDTEIIEGHTKAYTEGCQLPWQMEADFLPHFFTSHDYTPPQIWLGSVPINVPASSLHRDPLDGFLYQIMGRKKVLLYSPDQAPYLYPMKAYNNYQPCWVKPEAPDLDHFPLFAKARPIEVILYPGDILVQPAGWFHAVYCLDSPTFSVSYFLTIPVGVSSEHG